MTHDGIAVRFRKKGFEHIFYESTNRDHIKNKFSKSRAERIDWIKTALEDSTLMAYVGWNKKKRRHDRKRRVVIANGCYVVVIHILGETKANHVTAYVAESETIAKIKEGPKWE